MPRSALAYLNDVVESCDAVVITLSGVGLADYESNRTLRSAVEREFTIIGEAINSLSRLDSEVAARISHARKIVGFRNQLVHDYAAIVDATVWAIAVHDAPVLRDQCALLIDELRRAD
jgi:uncharacterized protein with HEPN domain